MQTVSRFAEPFIYDVFLCFRGVDTRVTFVDNLYNALKDLGLLIFKDDNAIEKGSKISKELDKAIEKSRIFIIVLSKKFASSPYCLNEVVKILNEFDKGKGRWVLPIFYYVEPTALADAYKHDFDDHMHKKRFNADRIELWRAALKKLSHFCHWHLTRDRNICEHQYIEHILKEVSRHVTCPIGLGDRILKVHLQLQLNSESYRVHRIGLYGETGMGKTTVARGVYNSIADGGFYHCHFFDNVGENLSMSGGFHQEMSILKGKKAFIIFEDINQSKQLENIIEQTEQLGSGSIVIITTQNNGMFDRYGIKNIPVGRFTKTEAYELLMLKAFNSKNVRANLVSLLSRVGTYALGNPWTLEVIGSNLSGIPIEKWESVLEKYESVTDRDIQKILEESFNSLEKCQQEMLINIVPWLNKQLVDVEAKLHKENKVCPRIDIRVLLDKSLIKINQQGQVTMHTSTRDMIKDEVPRFEAIKHGHGQRKSKEIHEQHVMQNQDILELEPLTKNPVSKSAVSNTTCMDVEGMLALAAV